MGRVRMPKKDWTPDQPCPDATHEKIAQAFSAGYPDLTYEQIGVKAGWPKKSARKKVYQTIQHEHVESRIKWLMSEAARLSIMEIAERKKLLSDIARGLEEDQFEALDKDGAKHTLKAKMLKQRISAMQELNKLDGSYQDNRQGSGLNGAMFQLVVKDARTGREVKIGESSEE